MTREEWIEQLSPARGVVFQVSPQGREELAALLREPAGTLMESHFQLFRKTIRFIENTGFRDDHRDLIIGLQKLLDRHVPLKVVWVDVGCNSVATVGEYSLSVWRDGKSWGHTVRREQNGIAVYVGGDCASRERDAAKRAAEAKLKELLGK